MTKRLLLVASFLLVAAPLLAQQAPAPGTVSDVIEQFRSAASNNWLRIAEDAGTNLFGWLTLIECFVAVLGLVLSYADMPTWSAEMMRRTLVIGVMYGLLTMGPGLAGLLLQGYTVIGERAAGINGGISASDILADGVNITATLFVTAADKAGDLSFLTALLMTVAGVAVLWSFLKLIKAFIIARIESYITISAAAIQLAWGGSRFTNTYAERYVGSAIANGVRIMVVYLIVGIERRLVPSWIQQTADLGWTMFDAGVTKLILLTMGIVLFCAIADVEKWAAAIFGGQPQFASHDVTNTYSPIVSAGIGAIAAGTSAYLTIQSAGLFAPVAAGAAGSAGAAAAGAGGGGGASYAGMNSILALSSAGSGAGGADRSYRLPPPPPAGPQRLLPPPAMA